VIAAKCFSYRTLADIIYQALASWFSLEMEKVISKSGGIIAAVTKNRIS
jgi:hypothetical protein